MYSSSKSNLTQEIIETNTFGAHLLIIVSDNVESNDSQWVEVGDLRESETMQLPRTTTPLSVPFPEERLLTASTDGNGLSHGVSGNGLYCDR